MVETVQHVSWGEFLTVIIGIISLISIITAMAFGRLSSLAERLGIVENQNKTDADNLKMVWEKINEMQDDRMNDRLLFMESINKLNLTLGKIEGTLENNNSVISELKEEMRRGHI